MSIRRPGPRKPPRSSNNAFGVADAEWKRLQLRLEHEGRWVAWTPDHESIVASGESLKFVDDEVQRLGHDVERVIFERIESAPRRVDTTEIG